MDYPHRAEFAVPDPVTAASIAEAANSPASATQDGKSAAAVPIDQQLKALDRLASEETLTGTNANGGPRSAWGRVRMARKKGSSAVE